MKRLRRIDPISFGINYAAIIAAVMFVFMLLFYFLFGSAMSTPSNMDQGLDISTLMGGMGIGMVVMGPIIYAIFGFIFGVIGASVYNFVAGITGGIKIEFEEEEVY